MKRIFDFSVAALASVLLAVPMLFVAFCIRVSSPGPILYWSKRVGRNNLLFWMPKFRTMTIDAPVVATHLLANPTQHLTPLGGFLRKTSLDELPQLLSILKGDMSFVGPRPALFNQDDLIAARTNRNVHRLTPGLTGWAQVNGRDDLAVPEKVELDAAYLQRQSFWFDMHILAITALKVVSASGVRH